MPQIAIHERRSQRRVRFSCRGALNSPGGENRHLSGSLRGAQYRRVWTGICLHNFPTGARLHLPHEYVETASRHKTYTVSSSRQNLHR
jgi:hypothetical protein